MGGYGVSDQTVWIATRVLALFVRHELNDTLGTDHAAFDGWFRTALLQVELVDFVSKMLYGSLGSDSTHTAAVGFGRRDHRVGGVGSKRRVEGGESIFRSGR